MGLSEGLMLAALACCCVLPAHGSVSAQRGWPCGAIFRNGNVPTVVAAVCLLAILVQIAFGIYAGSLSWWMLLYALVGYFGGGPVLWAALGRNAGMLAFAAAPLLTLAAPFAQ